MAACRGCRGRGFLTDQADPLSEARHHLAQGRHADAEAASRAFLTGNPANADALYILGTALLNQQRAADAVSPLRQAALSAPRDADVHYRLGMALYLDGQHEQAGIVLRHLLALTPANAWGHFLLGLIHHQNGVCDRAAVCYRRALSLDPSLRMAQDCLSNADDGLFFGASSGFQGAHAPARQVFLSAAVHALRESPGPLRILEIGSYMGSSTVTWARAIDRLAGKPGTIFCIDPWAAGPMYDFDGEMKLLMTRSDGAYQAFLRNIQRVPPAVTIDHRRGFSRDILPGLPADSFDIVYIDGSHYFEDVAADIRDAGRLVREGGLLCGDDLELQTDECDLDFARRHPRSDFVRDPKSGVSFHPGVTLAVGETLGRVSVYGGFWVMRRTEAGYQPVDLRDCEAMLPQHWPRWIVDELRERFHKSGELRQVHG